MVHESMAYEGGEQRDEENIDTGPYYCPHCSSILYFDVEDGHYHCPDKEGCGFFVNMEKLE